MLLYCADITQSTGEDWNDTTLTLSNANSQALQNLSVPKVDSLKLLPERRPPPPAGAFGSQPSRGGLFGGGLFGASNTGTASSSSFGAAPGAVPNVFGGGAQPAPAAAFGQPQSTTGPPPAPATAVVPQGFSAFGGSSFGAPPQEPGPAESVDEQGFCVVDERSDTPDASREQGAALDRTPLSLVYRVEGAVALPSDGMPHRVPITALELAATLQHVCVPRKTPAVFIEAAVKNTSEYELLPGPVSVFMDESFVTKTSIGVRRPPPITFPPCCSSDARRAHS